MNVFFQCENWKYVKIKGLLKVNTGWLKCFWITTSVLLWKSKYVCPIFILQTHNSFSLEKKIWLWYGYSSGIQDGVPLGSTGVAKKQWKIWKTDISYLLQKLEGLNIHFFISGPVPMGNYRCSRLQIAKENLCWKLNFSITLQYWVGHSNSSETMSAFWTKLD